jgi:fluoride exporter
LLRPFLGVGVLGGYTSFSAYVLDTQQTLAAGAPRVAVAYLAATVITALAAVWAAAAVTRWLIRPRRRRRERR